MDTPAKSRTHKRFWSALSPNAFIGNRGRSSVSNEVHSSSKSVYSLVNRGVRRKNKRSEENDCASTISPKKTKGSPPTCESKYSRKLPVPKIYVPESPITGPNTFAFDDLLIVSPLGDKRTLDSPTEIEKIEAGDSDIFKFESMAEKKNPEASTLLRELNDARSLPVASSSGLSLGSNDLVPERTTEVHEHGDGCMELEGTPQRSPSEWHCNGKNILRSYTFPFGSPKRRVNTPESPPHTTQRESSSASILLIHDLPSTSRCLRNPSVASEIFASPKPSIRRKDCPISSASCLSLLCTPILDSAFSKRSSGSGNAWKTSRPSDASTIKQLEDLLSRMRTIQEHSQTNPTREQSTDVGFFDDPRTSRSHSVGFDAPLLVIGSPSDEDSRNGKIDEFIFKIRQPQGRKPF